MTRVLLLGAGKIGRLIARLLTDAGDYEVCVADADELALRQLDPQLSVERQQVDAGDPQALQTLAAGRDVVISALSFRFNPAVAEAALHAGASYFDLTEDVETTRRVRACSTQAQNGQVFMPQCGLAPGFISILAQHLSQSYDRLDTIRVRVGALPQFPSNALKYNLTWSTDGLINEYCNPCEAIHNGRKIEALPLEGLEHFSMDGVRYEAFNTSGGIGSLCETFDGRVRECNYKTIRYLGHRQLAAFLVEELRLSERRELLRELLEAAIPITYQDMVVIFATVTGQRHGKLIQTSDARRIYPQTIAGDLWSAIQVTTAAGICAVVDLHRSGRLPTKGFIKQEDVDFAAFIGNRFGQYYEQSGTPPTIEEVLSAQELHDVEPGQ